MKKTIIPFAVLLSSLLIFSACEKNEYDDLGPDKSVWANGGPTNSTGNNNPGNDPGPKESEVSVFFASSNLVTPQDLEVNTTLFPVILKNQSPTQDVFVLHSTDGGLMLGVACPKGAFESGEVSTDRGNLLDFAYSLSASRRDNGNTAVVNSSIQDDRLQYATLQFTDFSSEKIQGEFWIKTFSPTGDQGFFEQHHAVYFTLYPTENRKLFDQ